MYSPEVLRILSSLDWRERRGSGIPEALASLDKLFDEVDMCRLIKVRDISWGSFSYLSAYERTKHLKPWLYVVKHYKVKKNYDLFFCCKKRAINSVVKIDSVYLDTWYIDNSAIWHDFLMYRARNETLSYGCFNLIEWYSFYCCISDNIPIELEYIAGIVEKCGGDPIYITGRDNARLMNVKFVYNLVNIFECLLNICEMRFSFIHDDVIDKAQKLISFNFNDMLDELALYFAVSPKIVNKEIRGFLTMCVRCAGIRAPRQFSLYHCVQNILVGQFANDFEFRIIPENLQQAFWNSDTMREAYNIGVKSLQDVKLFKLLYLCESVLSFSCVDERIDDVWVRCTVLVKLCSILLSIPKLAGFGRAYKYASAPRSADEKMDKVGMSERVKDLLLSLNDSAIESGHKMVTDSNWKQVCISYWNSKGAGVQPREVEIIVDDKLEKVKLRKKLGVGVSYGDDIFKKDMLSKKLNIDAPGNVGFRDVPYKPTRAIYVLPLSTLHAQIAVSYHLVNYVSTMGNNKGMISKQWDASHFKVGPEANTGVRIIDNYDTIAASGDCTTLCIDTDLSEFDSHNVYWNFRKGLIDALVVIGKQHKGFNIGVDEVDYINGNALDNVGLVPIGNHMSKNYISWNEMVEYAYGDGHVYRSWWDNGRRVFYFVYTEDYYSNKFDGLRDMFCLKRVGKAMRQGISGVINLSNVTVYEAKEMDKISALVRSFPDLSRYVKIGVALDGSDLVYLTSEASGELTTLFMNTVENLTVQRILYERLGETRLGRRLMVITASGVGDDMEWISKLLQETNSDEVSEFMLWLRDIYEECGHVLSVFKTFIAPCSAEYLQTFAKNGFYIPRDQIMVIASEKPRDVRSPKNFMMSVKRLFCSKISRGFSSSLSLLILLWMFRKLNIVELKESRITYRNVISLKSSFCDIKLRNFSLKRIFVRKNLRGVKQEYLKVENVIFKFSSLLALLPVCYGGIGLNPSSLMLVNTPSLLFYLSSLMKRNSANEILGFAEWIYNINLNLDLSEVSQSRIKMSKHALSLNSIFSSRVIGRLVNLKDIDIGRYDAKNVPKEYFYKGLEMEIFMRNVNASSREEMSRNVLLSLSKFRNGFLNQRDSWIMNFKLSLFRGNSIKSSVPFVVGLERRTKIVVDTFSYGIFGKKKGRSGDLLRRVISRDAGLRGIRTPEQVLDVLDEYGVYTFKDDMVGRIVLMRMGFEDSIINEILTLRYEGMGISEGGLTDGALTDDISLLTGLISERQFESLDFNVSILDQMYYPMFVFYQQVRVLHFILDGIFYERGIFEKEVEKSKFHKNLWNMPNYFACMSMKVKSIRKLADAVILDIL